jgi:6-phosphogluconolactonase
LSSSIEVRTLTTPQELFEAGAELVAHLTKESVEERGRFVVALSGGSTPRNLYNLLATNARNSLPWDRMYFFWGDERHVSPTDKDSNYRMAKEAMLEKVPVPPANIFRVPAENSNANLAAEEYEKTMRKFFGLADGQVPVFDLILLGLGPDGHTASLFPGTAALQEKDKLVVANWVEKFNTHRITFTLPVINAARCVAFVVSGMDKASALQAVLQSDAPGEKYPAKLVHPANGKLIWLVDRAAASALSGAA